MHGGIDENQVLTLRSGRKIGLATYGAEDGFPVLALHGAPASRVMFDVADAPAQRLGLKLYCPERPGYGLSPVGGLETLASRNADNREIVSLLGLTRFAVLGVSGGAPYAAAMAQDMPERVSQLLLVSPIGPVAEFAKLNTPIPIARGHKWFFLEFPKHRRLLKATCRLSAFMFRLSPNTFARLFRVWLTRSDRSILSQRHVRDSQVRMTLEALREGVDGGVSDLVIFSNPWEVQFGELDVPSRIWQGEEDRVVPVGVSFELGRRLPQAVVTRLEGAGHFWVYDHVREVLEAIDVEDLDRSDGVA